MSNRPALVRIEQNDGGGEARVVIALAWEDREYLGTATGPTGDESRPRLLGEATLRALEALSSNRVPFALDAIATADLGDSRIAMAKVLMGDGDPLVGNALVSDEEPGAAPVRAVLDALNRQLAPHI